MKIYFSQLIPFMNYRPQERLPQWTKDRRSWAIGAALLILSLGILLTKKLGFRTKTPLLSSNHSNCSSTSKVADFRSELKAKIQTASKPLERRLRDPFIPYHSIISVNGASIYLGNDQVRDALTTLATAPNPLEKLNASLVEEQKQLDYVLQGERAKVMTRLPALLVSVNGNTDGDDISPFPSVQVTGVKHIQHPISEKDEETYIKALDSEKVQKIFTAMDQAIIQSQDIFIHCNQGEHRSPAILILYLASRTELSFDQAWTYVQNKRTHIKATVPKNNRATLMTVAKELSDHPHN